MTFYAWSKLMKPSDVREYHKRFRIYVKMPWLFEIAGRLIERFR